VVYDKACSYTRTPKNTHVILELDYVLTNRGIVPGSIVNTFGRGFVTT
jgi:hypothetical protein